MDGNGTFNTEGELVWNGNGTVYFSHGTWNNSGTITITGNAVLEDGFGSNTDTFFNNSGILRKASANGSTGVRFLSDFTNTGLLEWSAGSLDFYLARFHNRHRLVLQNASATLGAGTSSGVFATGPGASLYFWADTHVLTNGAALTGAGTNYIGGSAVVRAAGPVGADHLQVIGGALDRQGELTVTNEFHWLGGVITGPGTLTLRLGSTGSFSGGTPGRMDGNGTFNTQGELLWNGNGTVYFNHGTWNNSGIITITGDANLEDGFGSNTDTRFRNSGTVWKSGGTGVSEFRYLTEFHNSREIAISRGFIRLPGSYSPQAGSVHRFQLGGPLVGTDYGQLEVPGTATLNGSLKVELASGYVPGIGERFTILGAFSRGYCWPLAPVRRNWNASFGLPPAVWVKNGGGAITTRSTRLWR